MVQVDVAKLQQLVDELQQSNPGILATDIWIRDTGESLASFNHQEDAVQLFTSTTKWLTDTLMGAEFPPLKDYFILNMANNHAVVVVLHGDDILQGFLLDTRHTNVGRLLGIGLPKALAGVLAARY